MITLPPVSTSSTLKQVAALGRWSSPIPYSLRGELGMATRPMAWAIFWVTRVTWEPVSQNTKEGTPPLVVTHWATICTSHPGSSVGVGSPSTLGSCAGEPFLGFFFALRFSMCRRWWCRPLHADLWHASARSSV